MEFTEFALDGQALCTFLDVSDHLSVDVETLADGDDLFCHFWTNVDFHAVPHVEHLVHLFPIGT